MQWIAFVGSVRIVRVWIAFAREIPTQRGRTSKFHVCRMTGIVAVVFFEARVTFSDRVLIGGIIGRVPPSPSVSSMADQTELSFARQRLASPKRKTEHASVAGRRRVFEPNSLADPKRGRKKKTRLRSDSLRQ